MEKRAIGAVLTLPGIIALVICTYYFINHTGGGRNFRVIITCVILGRVFFSSGIGLVRSTRDVINRNEKISKSNQRLRRQSRAS